MRTARSRGTAGKDNDARVPLTPRSVRTTTSCSTSTAACGSATSRSPGAAEAVAALREAGKAVLFLTNDVRHAPEEFVRKLWRLGFQASLDEVVTVGAARAVPARRARRRAPRSWSARRRSSTTSPTPACGSSTTRRSPRAPTSSWSAATTTSRYDELRIATQAVIRGAELIGATPRRAASRCPTARGRARARCSRRSRPPPGRTADARRRQAGAGDVRRGAATGSAPGRDARRRRPAGRRRRGRAPRGPGLGARAHRRRRRASRPTPPTRGPTHVADSLAALVLRDG